MWHTAEHRPGNSPRDRVRRHITECATEHPPYWNIVRYESGQGDLSTCEDYEAFRGLLMGCLKRCYDALTPGGRLAVLIGDARRAGRYTAIIKDVLNFPHGEIRSIIIKVQHNCTSDRKHYGKLEDPPIRHEYCVVFKKPMAEPLDIPAQRNRERLAPATGHKADAGTSAVKTAAPESRGAAVSGSEV